MYKPTLNSSLLESRSEERTDFASQLFGNASFRIGIILEAIDVEDEKNISKLGPEYNVMTIEQDKQNGQGTSIYKNCITMDGFGGVADFFQFTRRTAKKPKETKKKGTLKDEVGSIVGILCLDGNSEKAVIMGSFGNPSKLRTLEKDKEHNMEGEFNGINWKVDKDGALTITFRSNTDDEGLPQNIEAGGTALKMEKDGSFEINNGPLTGELKKKYLKPKDGEEGQSEEEEAASEGIAYEKIRLDKTKKTIDVESREDMSFKTDKNFNLEAKESMNITLKKDLITMAEGKAAFTLKKSFELKAKGKCSIEAQQIMAESKSMIQFKASSMFQAEAASSMILKAPQVMLGPSPAQPALLAYDLIVLGTGNLGAPVVSNAIAGYSTSIIISA